MKILLGFILFVGAVLFGISDFAMEKLNWRATSIICLLWMLLGVFVMALQT
jgi:hypothetical protein